MLSLPLITPRADASLWPSHRVNSTSVDSSATPTESQNLPHGPNRRPNSQHGQPTSRSLLAALAADENAIYSRKQNVRRFGAGWIRPPGVAKTYQATMDEAAEREEQEMLARREQVLLDLAAAQDEANQQTAQGEEDEEMAEGERDLDDDVPEAEEEDSEPDEEDESVAEADTSAVSGHGHGHGHDMTFNEDSFIEGSMVEHEVEQMLEMEEAEMAGVLQDERDLDDDIPEAGSYEHTETELEDSSSDGEDDSFGPGQSVGRRSAGRRSSGFRPARGGRSSFEGSSSILDGSSFLRSSPAAARGAGSVRSRFMSAQRPRGG